MSDAKSPLTHAQQARRDRIVDAGLALLAARDYDRIQVKDVAEEANVALPAAQLTSSDPTLPFTVQLVIVAAFVPSYGLSLAATLAVTVFGLILAVVVAVSGDSE